MPISKRVSVLVETKHKNETAARNETALNICNSYKTQNIHREEWSNSPPHEQSIWKSI